MVSISKTSPKMGKGFGIIFFTDTSISDHR